MKRQYPEAARLLPVTSVLALQRAARTSPALRDKAIDIATKAAKRRSPHLFRWEALTKQTHTKT